jgi:hypothetical protein
VLDFVQHRLVPEGTISESDLKLAQVTDDPDEAMAIIEAWRTRNGDFVRRAERKAQPILGERGADHRAGAAAEPATVRAGDGG